MGHRKDFTQTFVIRQFNAEEPITVEAVARAVSTHQPSPESIGVGKVDTDAPRKEAMRTAALVAEEVLALRRALVHARGQNHDMVREMLSIVESAENAVHLGMMLQRFFEEHGQK